MDAVLRIEKRVQEDIKKNVILNLEKKLKAKVTRVLTEILQTKNFHHANLNNDENNVFIYYGKKYLENGNHICVSFSKSKIITLVVENDSHQKTFTTSNSYRHNEIQEIISNIDFLQKMIDK
ncbi:hypothetical protein Xen7305DRAFT_00033990 [Xenococcus sp. PCC 7305]|uniref:hypothetical protein n=1 Tax=Xenococcus sp. PCC 7305 TaxID=102125 RepID=UPI0002AC8C0E|nr:hypothetical protein [Xenococcus sp. PCC 7305]ELS03675.1 hypothetical protein Xen7305DRAFT_00033990 [Xenococcus sp. PCC 7305]